MEVLGLRCGGERHCVARAGGGRSNVALEGGAALVCEVRVAEQRCVGTGGAAQMETALEAEQLTVRCCGSATQVIMLH